MAANGNSMRVRIIAAAAILLLLGAWGLLRAQKALQELPRPFKEYPAAEYVDFPLPGDWNQKTEWTRARLKYPSTRYRGYRGDLNWTIDYPRSDRHLLEGVRRLTRIDTRSVEQVVELDGEDDVYNWPMLYAVEVGYWTLPGNQPEQLREFIDRGGFLMVDDFHSTREWAGFMAAMTKVFPDREVEDIPDSDPIFHTLYDLSERFQVPGAQYLYSGRTYEKDENGRPEHWRCIRDAKGRIIVAICHNMDLGDAWEWSDDPRYDEKFAGLAYRIAMNYFIYDLSH
jgi:hypothetical protein